MAPKYRRKSKDQIKSKYGQQLSFKEGAHIKQSILPNFSPKLKTDPKIFKPYKSISPSATLKNAKICDRAERH
jgi:hypothetical protein